MQCSLHQFSAWLGIFALDTILPPPIFYMIGNHTCTDIDLCTWVFKVRTLHFMPRCSSPSTTPYKPIENCVVKISTDYQLTTAFSWWTTPKILYFSTFSSNQPQNPSWTKSKNKMTRKVMMEAEISWNFKKIQRKGFYKMLRHSLKYFFLTLKNAPKRKMESKCAWSSSFKVLAIPHAQGPTNWQQRTKKHLINSFWPVARKWKLHEAGFLIWGKGSNTPGLLPLPYGHSTTSRETTITSLPQQTFPIIPINLNTIWTWTFQSKWNITPIFTYITYCRSPPIQRYDVRSGQKNHWEENSGLETLQNILILHRYQWQLVPWNLQLQTTTQNPWSICSRTQKR